MKPPFIKSHDGRHLHSWAEWPRPKRDYQWKEGRSAMELAKAWFPDDAPAVPPEIENILLSKPRLEDLQLIEAVPELVTGLPERGEGRNHDLWIIGRTRLEQVTICIEAKADEPFGNDTVSGYRNRQCRRREQGEHTKAPERIDALLEMVGGELSNWGEVRYQLLAGFCGTILQAKKDLSELAVFIVHEFQTDLTTADRLQENSADFELFLRIIGTDKPAIGMLSDPVAVKGVECLIGKAIRLN
ncbi:DUF6946 family protein [Desulfosalsimonas propionicica]